VHVFIRQRVLSDALYKKGIQTLIEANVSITAVIPPDVQLMLIDHHRLKPTAGRKFLISGSIKILISDGELARSLCPGDTAPLHFI